MKCPVCKKNIPQNSLKCPYCKTRTGILCSRCGTVNPPDALKCEKCSQQLLKICKNCGSVNYPAAVKCRKCSSPFAPQNSQNSKNIKKKSKNKQTLQYAPELFTLKQAVEALSAGILSDDKKIFSISGEKGVGKSSVLNKVIKNLEPKKLQWCIGRCTPLTQLTPGGVIQNMLLNLFRLPNFCMNNDELQKNAFDFFNKEFSFLNSSQVNDFLNFIYNFKDGDYEDIIINKKRTYEVLNQIFDAFAATGRFVFVVDNFDFIDGFSAEFLTDFMRKDKNWKNLKFIALYNDYRPITSFFGFEEKSLKAYKDISLYPTRGNELKEAFRLTFEGNDYVSNAEEDIILSKCGGNLAFVEQAASYAFDCQINDKPFLLPDNFSQIIKQRLQILKSGNTDAYRLLCGFAILGDRININMCQEVFAKDIQNFDDIVSYLVKSKFIRPYDDVYYEFNNLLLWETILKTVTKDSVFEDINVKIARAISAFNLNTNAIMAMIAQNLKENRISFDIWTKITRLAAYVGDINLFVIAQKQCLALLNEFKEEETVNIRYSISEKLGKLLSEYDPEEAMEYLPDAIAHVRDIGDEVKEIELLGYLSYCCCRNGNYFGNVECVDSVLKKLKDGQSLEKALILTAKLQSLSDIGNCGEVINLIENDILPVLNSNLAKPRLSKLFPPGILFDTWLKVNLVHANVLALQGNEKVTSVLKNLFTTIDKHHINDKNLIYKAKLVLAYSHTMRGNFAQSNSVLREILADDTTKVDYSIISRKNLISILNKFLLKDYENIRQELFEAVTFANNIGDSFTKHILKTFLGAVFQSENQVKHAIDIYNEQITYFAKEKMALGALLSWYLISGASVLTENTKGALDIAQRALEIAQSPKVDNLYFISILNLLIAGIYVQGADFQSAKMYLEKALNISKKHKLKDVLSRVYLEYGNYYYEIGLIQSSKQLEYLKGSAQMYEQGLELIVKDTGNSDIKSKIIFGKEKLNDYCLKNGFKL